MKAHYIAFDNSEVVTDNGIIRSSDVNWFSITITANGKLKLRIRHKDNTETTTYSEHGVNFYLE